MPPGSAGAPAGLQPARAHARNGRWAAAPSPPTARRIPDAPADGARRTLARLRAMPAFRLLRSCLPLLLAGAAAAQMPLAEVAKLARDRAERSRPAQLKALEPYWPDLAALRSMTSANCRHSIKRRSRRRPTVLPKSPSYWASSNRECRAEADLGQPGRHDGTATLAGVGMGQRRRSAYPLSRCQDKRRNGSATGYATGNLSVIYAWFLCLLCMGAAAADAVRAARGISKG